MPTLPRLLRLQKKLERCPALTASAPDGLTTEELLQIFDAWSKHPVFAAHRTFIKELQDLHTTVELARQRLQPLWEPPERFLPGLPLRERRLRWREPLVYPEVHFSLMKAGIRALGILQWELPRTRTTQQSASVSSHVPADAP